MLFSYNELLKILKNDYQIKMAVNKKKIYKIESGIYSTIPNCNKYEIIMKRYPTSLLVGETALYLKGYLSKEPDKIHLGTKRNALRIKDKRVQQSFYSDFINLIKYHSSTIQTENNISLPTFTDEYLLIDLLRKKRNYSTETFNDAINHFKYKSSQLKFSYIEDELIMLDLLNDKNIDYLYTIFPKLIK